jgi:hypothetical protein
MSYIYSVLDSDSAFDYAKVYDQFENVKRSEFKVLFDYMDQYAVEADKPLEFAPIAWICDFGLFTEAEAVNDYSMSLEELEEVTTVLKGDGFVWVQAF